MEADELCSVEHELDAFAARDIGYLVGVGDYGQGAMGDGETGEMIGREES